MATSCLVELTGSVDILYIDSLLIEGAFQNSPISIAANDPTWNVDLSYIEGGYEGISVSAYATDTLTGNQLVCSQVNLTIEINAPETDFSVVGNCSNIPFEFNDLSIPYNTDTIVSWNWSFTGLGTSTDQNPVVLLDSLGFVDVQLVVQSSDGCIDDTTISVEVSAAPDANFTFTEVCLGGSTNFHDHSEEGDESIVNWSWDFADGNTSSLEDPVHIYADTGYYPVQLVVTDIIGCSDSIVQGVEVFPCSPVNVTELSESILIYPNPAKDQLHFESGPYTINRLRVIDGSGRLVMEEGTKNGGIDGSVSLRGLSTGIYSLELTIQNHGVIHKQLVIQ